MEKRKLSALLALGLLSAGSAHSAQPELPTPIQISGSPEASPRLSYLVETYRASESSSADLQRVAESMRRKLLMTGPFEISFGGSRLDHTFNVDTLPAPGIMHRLASVNAYILKITSDADVSFVIQSLPRFIQDVSMDILPSGMNPDVESLLHTQDASNEGATGSGWHIVTIDTGIDPNHPALLGRVAKSICVREPGCANGERVDHSAGAGGHCWLSIDTCRHGTATASLAADMSETNQITYLTKTVGDVAIALDDLIRSEVLPVAALSMSIGWNNPDKSLGVVGSCTSSEPLFEALFRALVAKGIAAFVASGNNSFANGALRPACITLGHAPVDGLIAVGASTKEDTIADFSNRDPITVFHVAPGDNIVVAEAHTRGLSVASGTSLAAPIAAAAGARLRGAFPGLKPEQIESLLLAGGRRIDEEFLTDNGNVMRNWGVRVDMAMPARLRDISTRPKGRTFLPHMRGR